jgi:hypothetical protein
MSSTMTFSTRGSVMGLGMAGLSRAGRRRARPQTLGRLLSVAATLPYVDAAAAPPGFQGQPFDQSRAYWATGVGRPGEIYGRSATVSPVWFICDPMTDDGVIVMTLPDRFGRVTPATPLVKGEPAYYGLGAPDPGAGQIYWPLSTPDQGRIGQIHAFNPGMLTDPKAATTPTFTSIRIAGAQWNCRWLQRTRLMGFSFRRTVAITRNPNGELEYRTYDFKDARQAKQLDRNGPEQTTAPSLDIKGGRTTPRGFEFEHNGSVYDVAADATGASITVRQRGRRVLREPLIAWTIAPAP